MMKGPIFTQKIQDWSLTFHKFQRIIKKWKRLQFEEVSMYKHRILFSIITVFLLFSSNSFHSNQSHSHHHHHRSSSLPVSSCFLISISFLITEEILTFNSSLTRVPNKNDRVFFIQQLWKYMPREGDSEQFQRIISMIQKNPKIV